MSSHHVEPQRLIDMERHMATRRAVGLMAFGGPEVLQVMEMPVTPPGPGDVVIGVAAAAINPADAQMRSGARQIPWDPPYVPGMDAAGTVEAVGSGVDLPIGAVVMAVVSPWRPEGGAYAERITVPAAQAIEIPEGATVEQAATLPMNGLTAKIAHDWLDLQPGQTLGVTGAAGVLGGYAIALAVNRGLRVVADARPEDEGLVRSFGAHEIVARGDGVGQRMRAVTVGGVDGLLYAAVQGGQVLAGVRDGGRVAAARDFNGTAERGITIHRIEVMKHLDDHDGLTALRDLASRGDIALRVAGTFAPEDASEAHRRFEQGGVRGRFVITF
jgi:NADPH:quinone reductase-like Zn-dependent oxidoreductase